MPLPGSGAIKFSQLMSEFNNSFTKMSQYYNVASGVPSSGSIKFSNLHGKSASTPSLGVIQNLDITMSSTYTSGSIIPINSVSDTYGSPIVYSVSSKPSWINTTLNSSTGFLSWNISATKFIASDTLVITVTNRFNRTSIANVSVNVGMTSSMSIPSTTTTPTISTSGDNYTDGVGSHMTTIVGNNVDDQGYKITLPFTFNWLGKNYGNDNNGGVYIISNSFITFGANSTARTSLSQSNPNVPSIFIAAGDFLMYKLYGFYESSLSRYRVRYEGNSSYLDNGTAVTWEACFFTNSSIVVSVSAHGASGNIAMITDGKNSYQTYSSSVPLALTLNGFSSYLGMRYPSAALTNNTTALSDGTYVASTSYMYDTTYNQPYKAFDRNEGDWASGWSCVGKYDANNGVYNGSTTTTISGSGYGGEWIQLQTPNAFVLRRFGFKPRNDWVGGYRWRMPSVFKIAGSTDGTTWSLVYEGYDVSYSNYNVAYFDCSANTTAYNYYRLVVNVSGNFGECCSSGARDGVDIAEFYMFA